MAEIYGNLVQVKNVGGNVNTTTNVEKQFIRATVGMEVAKAIAVELIKLSKNDDGGGRWVQISVKNECGFVLEKVGQHFDCGRTDNVLAAKIETGQVRTIAVTNSMPLIGVKGILKYKLVGHPDGVYMIIYFENPYRGSNYHTVQFSIDDVPDCELYDRISKIDTRDIATTHWGDSVYGVSSMIDGDRSAMGICLTAGSVNAGGEEKSFRSYHNTYLRAHPTGGVDLAPDCQDYEKWYMISHGNNKCSLRSAYGTYLRGTPDGNVDVVANRDEWEEWTLIHSSGKIGLKSCHGTFIRAKDDNYVDLVGDCKAWELWTVTTTEE